MRIHLSVKGTFVSTEWNSHATLCYRSRVFILGPSHHFYTRQCCLSPASHFETPLGELSDTHCSGIASPVSICVWSMADEAVACCPGAVPLSTETYRELRATGEFDMLDVEADEVRSACPKTCTRLGLHH